MIRKVFILIVITAFGIFPGCINQKKITSDTYQSLNMEKQQGLLTGQQWLLIELVGKAVPGDKDLNNQPVMQMRLNDNRITGNGSCNNFFGTFEMKGDNRLTVSDIGATKMACPEMEIERAFFEALGKVDNFSFDGNQLLLRQDELILARFVSVNQ